MSSLLFLFLLFNYPSFPYSLPSPFNCGIPRLSSRWRRDHYAPELTGRKAMIEEFDLDQDGAINEQEFLAIMLDGE